jgi:hypothetical protein
MLCSPALKQQVLRISLQPEDQSVQRSYDGTFNTSRAAAAAETAAASSFDRLLMPRQPWLMFCLAAGSLQVLNLSLFNAQRAQRLKDEHILQIIIE